jgi:ubiquinone/menaquinone biosynthesis C-methylase UbiE
MSGSFRDAELTGWSTRSVTYDAQLAPVTNQVASHVLEALGPLSGKQVLDVCCGPGHLAGAIAEAGGAPEGLDFAASMVDRARENYPQLVFRQGDAEALPYGDQTFDHVVCAFGVMHLSRPEAAFAEALRVLRPRGLYIFTQWALDDELLSIVLSAIGRHGEIPTSLPPAPPPLRFSDPLECRRALEITGFTSVADTRIETSWTAERPEALLDLVYGGAVRAAMILEAQTPERRARIHENILAEAKARISGDLIVIRRPSVMAWGTKA